MDEGLAALAASIDRFEERVVTHTAEVSMLRYEVARNEEEVKRNRREFVATLLLLLLLIFGQATYSYFENQEARQRRAEIQDTLAILKDAVDPKSAIGKANAVRTAEAVGLIVLENECRTRRALAGLPPVEVGQTCKLP